MQRRPQPPAASARRAAAPLAAGGRGCPAAAAAASFLAGGARAGRAPPAAAGPRRPQRCRGQGGRRAGGGMRAACDRFKAWQARCSSSLAGHGGTRRAADKGAPTAAGRPAGRGGGPPCRAAPVALRPGGWPQSRQVALYLAGRELQVQLLPHLVAKARGQRWCGGDARARALQPCRIRHNRPAPPPPHASPWAWARPFCVAPSFRHEGRCVGVGKEGGQGDCVRLPAAPHCPPAQSCSMGGRRVQAGAACGRLAPRKHLPSQHNGRSCCRRLGGTGLLSQRWHQAAKQERTGARGECLA